MKLTMKAILAALLVLGLGSAIVFAETKSDYERGFDFSKFRTWDFKQQARMPRDQLGANGLWKGRIRQAFETDLQKKGYERDSRHEPRFLVAYYMGARQQLDTRVIGYGFPGGWRRWGWGTGGAEVWQVPYTKSTLVLDIIDAQTNQLVWRGYDTETIDFNKSEKTIQKSVEKLVERFVKETHSEKS